MNYNINIIVAINTFGFIGKNNDMMWHSTSDFKKFKELTLGNTVLMGRNTYESIGKPLPNRKNIVVSSTLVDDRVEVIDSINSIDNVEIQGDLFIIGGEKIFDFFVEKADNLYITVIENSDIGDKRFSLPPLNIQLENSMQLSDGKGKFYHFTKINN